MRAAPCVPCALLALAALGLACSTGTNEVGPGPAGAAGRPAASGATGGTTGGSGGSGTGGSGAADAGPSLTCDQCGSSRADACEAEFAACEADPACARILDCVYVPPGCALDQTGAACVERCAELECQSSDSIDRFLSAESCAFCIEACSLACSAYCAPLSQVELGCTGGASGASG